MKISRYLTFREATHSDTAKREGIKNIPNKEQVENMVYTAMHIFDPVREMVGGPLFASSFFRCEELNIAIGGSKTSQHVKGQAIDIDCDRYQNGTNGEVFHFIKDHLEFDQLIAEAEDNGEPAWVHVSLKKEGRNRGQVLIMTRRNGKTEYLPYSEELYEEIYG